MYFIVGDERSRVCVCMTHVALPCQAIMHEISTSAHARLRFYGSGRPFIQLLSNGLENMSSFACHKLEHTDKATVSLILFVCRFHPELELSFTALGLCCCFLYLFRSL